MYQAGHSNSHHSSRISMQTWEAPAASETLFHCSSLHSGHTCASVLQVCTVSPLEEGNSGKPHHSMYCAKQRGMAAELADILSQLDDAARLADELDFGVKSRSPQRG